MKYSEHFAAKLEADPEAMKAWQILASWASPQLLWAQMFIPHWMTVPFSKLHSDMMRVMYDGLIGRIPTNMTQTALIAPRSFAKSTCAKIVALYYMTEGVACGDVKPRMGRDFDLFYVTAEHGLAKDTFMSILYELEHNELLMSQYNKQLMKYELGPPLNIWLFNGIRASARGVMGRLRGDHPAAGLFDDIQAEANISSDEQRMKFTEFYETVIRQMFIRHVTFPVFAGNYMHLFDTYRHIALQRNTNLALRQALVNVKGRRVSAWPAMYPTKSLLEEEADNPDKFSTEKMNNPVVSTQSVIKLDDVRWYDSDEQPEKWWSKLVRVTITDPAARHQARNCETAIVTVGWNRAMGEPDIYVVDAKMGHWSTESILTQNYNIFAAYHPHFQGIEDIGFQDALRLLMNQSQNKPTSFNLQPHDSCAYIDKASGDAKRSRIDSVATYFTHNRVYFDKRCPAQRRIVDQLISYSRGDKFDGGDAFCMAVNELAVRFPPQGRIGTIRRPQIIRNPYTGIIEGYR